MTAYITTSGAKTAALTLPATLTAAGQWCIATGTSEAIVGNYPTPVTVLTDGLLVAFRAGFANTTTTPTFTPSSIIAANPITMEGGGALFPQSIEPAYECLVRFNLANARWELLNPNPAATSGGTLTLPLAISIGGTDATTAGGARGNLGAAASGANSDITSLTGLTTALSIAQGGTGGTTAAAARTALSVAASGTNGDITKLTGLTTPLSIAQGGTGQTTPFNLIQLSDVLSTIETAPNDGYVLTWKNLTQKWIAAQVTAATTMSLHGLTDVSVTEGSPIDTYYLAWNNGAGYWEAVAPGTGSKFSALSDVSITEASGIDTFIPYWNNSAGFWEAIAPRTYKNINAQTSGYTLVLGDAGALVKITDASANNLTIPLNSSVAFPIGTVVDFIVLGAGITTVVATSGVTLVSANSAVANTEQYQKGTLIKTATDTWLVAFYDSGASGAGSLATLTDVNVTEGSGIDQESLVWNNGTSKWIAAPMRGVLSGLMGSTVPTITSPISWTAGGTGYSSPTPALNNKKYGVQATQSGGDAYAVTGYASYPSTPFAFIGIVVPGAENAANNPQIGVTDGTKYIGCGWASNTQKPFVADYATVGASVNSTLHNGAQICQPNSTFFAVTDDGSTLIFWTSVDGYWWAELYSTTHATPGSYLTTPTDIYWGCLGGGGAGAAMSCTLVYCSLLATVTLPSA